MTSLLPTHGIDPDFKQRVLDSARIESLQRNGGPPSVARLDLAYTSTRSADRHYPFGRPGVESEGLPSGGFSLFRRGTVTAGHASRHSSKVV